jgi:hypothetical protein
MPSSKQSKKKSLTTVLPVGTSMSTPATVSDSTTPTVTPTAPPATSIVMLAAPPNVGDVPSVPAGFSPVTLNLYRGFRPKADQLAAAPDAINELRDFPTFVAVFGATAPSPTQLADELSDALAWAAFRIAVEALLQYAKSGEAVSWKTILLDLDKLAAAIQLITSTNPSALAGCPALVRMLEVPKVIAKQGNAARARTLATNKAKAAAAAVGATTVTSGSAAPAATTATTPAATPAPAGSSGTGGAPTH